MIKEKIYLSWQQFYERLTVVYDQEIGPGAVVYGVPKNGMITAGFLTNKINANCSITSTPSAASIILDDIVDSGRTKDSYIIKHPDAKFVSLFDKKELGGKWIVFPWEAEHPKGEDSIQENIVRILQYLGEDPGREGLKKTPERVTKSWNELYAGYGQDEKDLFTTFKSDGYDQIVLLKDIELYSTCEHHMLPIYGKAHVAYIPNGRVVGISKLARLVDMYARRLQIQERIGEQVTKALMEHLNPIGAACIIEARHMCMCARGVGKQNSIMTTSSLKGAFLNEHEARQELLTLVKGR